VLKSTRIQTLPVSFPSSSSPAPPLPDTSSPLKPTYILQPKSPRTHREAAEHKVHHDLGEEKIPLDKIPEALDKFIEYKNIVKLKVQPIPVPGGTGYFFSTLRAWEERVKR
jgi:hypothetical protein